MILITTNRRRKLSLDLFKGLSYRPITFKAANVCVKTFSWLFIVFSYELEQCCFLTRTQP